MKLFSRKSHKIKKQLHLQYHIFNKLTAHVISLTDNFMKVNMSGCIRNNVPSKCSNTWWKTRWQHQHSNWAVSKTTCVLYFNC